MGAQKVREKKERREKKKERERKGRKTDNWRGRKGEMI